MDLARHIANTCWPGLNRLSRLAYIAGNLAPDFNIPTYIRGHSIKGAGKVMARKLRRLEGKTHLGPVSYWHLGVLSHYVADIFTTPHNGWYEGSLWDHRIYEKKLRQVFRQNLDRVRAFGGARARLEKPMEYLRRKHSEYMAQVRSFEIDCQYIIAVTTKLANAFSGTEPQQAGT